MELGTIPTIVYPAKGLDEVFDRKSRGIIEKYLESLWELNQGLISPATEYMIGMVWNECADKMTDLWTHRNSQGYGFGPLVDVKLFRNFQNYIPDQNKKEVEEGSASGNTIVLLAAEELQRVEAGGLKRFLSGERPSLPARIRLGQNFYL